jgi:hypothetical protein
MKMMTSYSEKVVEKLSIDDLLDETKIEPEVMVIQTQIEKSDNKVVNISAVNVETVEAKKYSGIGSETVKRVICY